MPPLKLDKTYVTARRALIVWDRLHGHTIQTLTEKYNLSPKQMSKELRLAKQTGLVTQIEQKILGQLSNKALELYEKALADGDLFVAKDVLNHAAKIADRHAKKEEQQQGMSLQLWLQLRREQLKSGSEEVIDVTHTSAEAGALGQGHGDTDGPDFTETLAQRHREASGPLSLTTAHPVLFPGAAARGRDDDGV